MKEEWDKYEAMMAREAESRSALSGSAGSAGLSGYKGTPLDQVRAWFQRFILTIDDDDYDILALWAAHTHLVDVTYTSPRLILDSPVPGSGKTTVLEHLGHLCQTPLQAASLSSPALLTRLLDRGMRTVLIDEVDRTLNPKKEGVDELLAVINSGYKRGASRPVLVQVKDGWEPQEMSTYSPIAMAGNAPNLPDDTRSRCVRVLLFPDNEGVIEESDWEMLDEEADALGLRLATWAQGIRDDVAKIRPLLPEKCVGRAKERWAPFARIAAVCGGRWPATVRHLIERELAEIEADREDGVVGTPIHVQLVKDIYELWPSDHRFMSTEIIRVSLIANNPEMWGSASRFGKDLTVQRMGRMLARSFKINSSRPDTHGPRGYMRDDFRAIWRRFKVDGVPGKPDHLAEPAKPDHSAEIA